MTQLLKKVANSNPGDTDHVGGDDWDTLSDYHANVDLSPKTSVVNTSSTFASGKLTIDGYYDVKVVSAPGSPSSGYGRIYPKTIDANNDGLFIKIKKGGAFVEVQIG